MGCGSGCDEYLRAEGLNIAQICVNLQSENRDEPLKEHIAFDCFAGNGLGRDREESSAEAVAASAIALSAYSRDSDSFVCASVLRRHGYGGRLLASRHCQRHGSVLRLYAERISADAVFPTPAKAQGGTDKLHGVAIYSYVVLGGFVLLSTFLPWYSIIFNFAPFYLVFSLSQGVTYIDGELATGDLVATVKASLAVLLPFYALKVLLSAFLL